MTDYTSEGAVPIEDAAVDDPPTVDEVLEEQRRSDDLPDPSADPRHIQIAPVGAWKERERGELADPGDGAADESRHPD